MEGDRRRWGYLAHALIGGLSLLAIFLPGQVTVAVRGLADRFLQTADGLTLAVAGGAVLFCFAITVSPLAKARIGGPDARPEFKTTTWLAMLFAAGMGAGLVFWGAAEPLIHTLSPPPGGPEAGTPEARREALAIVQFHWALHAWGVYAVASLAIAIALSRADAVPLPSTPFPKAPLAIKRVIDWTALIAVIFGVVASLGQGVFQLAAGLERLTGGGVPSGAGSQIVVLAVLALCYLGSAAAGLRRGIAILSNVNAVLAVALALFVLMVGPFGAILSTFGETLSTYVSDLWRLSVTLRPEGAGREWTRDWSLTYFLWWIAWTPFVGVFVARISRGRTMREFVLGVVVVPSLVTIVWFSILGGAALALNDDGAVMREGNFATAAFATYRLLEQLPLALLSSTVTFLLVFFFMLTSADSGAYVLGMFSSGRADPPMGERLYWGVTLAVLTGAAVLSEAGQNATRAFAVVGAIPLTALLVAQAIAVIRLPARRK